MNDYARTALEKFGEAGKAGSNVHFLGKVGNIERNILYEKAHTFIFPSVGEVFRNLYRGMKYHLPVIARNFGVSPEIVRSGLDGMCMSRRQIRLKNLLLKCLINLKRAEPWAILVKRVAR
jgi:glycosyltransferase involved in cell wall biosynthesis